MTDDPEHPIAKLNEALVLLEAAETDLGRGDWTRRLVAKVELATRLVNEALMIAEVEDERS